MNHEDFPPLSASTATSTSKPKPSKAKKKGMNHQAAAQGSFDFQACQQALFMPASATTEMANGAPAAAAASPSTNPTSTPDQQESLEELYSEAVEIALTGPTMQSLENLFGEAEGSPVSPPQEKETRLRVPVWMGEYLFRVSKNLAVPDYFSPAAQPEVEVEGDGDGRDSPKTSTIAEENGAYKVEILNQLYEIFCNMPQQLIRGCARSHGYDFMATFNELLEVSSTEPVPASYAAVADQPQYITIIPSNCPQPIKPIKPVEKRSPNDYFYDLMKSSYTMEEVDALREKAAAIRLEKERYRKVANYTKEPGARCYYQQQARGLEQQALGVLTKSDLILLGINSNEPVIDLHGMTPERANKILAMKIDFIRDNYRHLEKLQVITGYGKTLGIPSVVKSSVISYLRKHRIQHCVEPKNMGSIVITLTGINQRLSSS